MLKKKIWKSKITILSIERFPLSLIPIYVTDETKYKNLCSSMISSQATPALKFLLHTHTHTFFKNILILFMIFQNV